MGDHAEPLRREIVQLLANGGTVLPGVLARQFGVPVDTVRELVAREEAEAPGRHIGRYRIRERLGHGSMGVVYRAHDPSLGRDVALKVLAPHLSESPEAIQRLQREASALARLSHPSLVPVYEVGEAEGRWFFAMELIEGPSLQEWVEMRRAAGHTSLADEGRGELTRFLDQFAHLASALDLAHEAGFLHRDIKPSNVLVGEDGQLKLVDFGLARDLGLETMTVAGATLGTPMYMSPEQLAGAEALDRRSDVYSLGMTLYEAVTYQPPHPGGSLGSLSDFVRRVDPPTPKSLGLRLPEDLTAIVFRAIEKDPARRYESAAALANDLRNLVAYRPVTARPAGLRARTRKAVLRHRTAVRTAGVTLAVVVLVAIASLLAPRVGEWLDRREATRAHAALEATAIEAFAAARTSPLEQREAAWRSALAMHPESAAASRARLEYADTLDQLERRHESKAQRAQVYLESTEATVAHRALAALGRSFLTEGRIKEAQWAIEQASASSAQPESPELGLLAAEVALASGRPGEALWYADALDAADSPDRVSERVEYLRAALERHSALPALEVGAAHHAAAGRFRNEGRHVALARNEGTCLVRIDTNAPRIVALEGLPHGKEASSLATGDFDEDGIDELIVITHAGSGNPHVAKSLVVQLAVCDIRGPRAVIRYTTTLVHASYQIVVGDFDHDQRDDILLAGSYPTRGVALLRNTGNFAFEALTRAELGDLTRLREGAKTTTFETAGGTTLESLDDGSDMRDFALLDIDGDGRSEIALAADQHELYRVLVFRYDSASGSFRMLHRREVGSVQHLAVGDLDGDGLQDLCFGLAGAGMANRERRAERFLPQGVYVLRWEREEATFRLDTACSFRRFRLRATSPEPGDLTNLSFDRLAVQHREGSLPTMVGSVTYGEESKSRGSYLACFPYTARPEPALLLAPRGYGPSPLPYDTNDDGSEEMIVVRDGQLRILGRRPAIEPVEPAPTRSSRILPSGLDARFDLAQRLLDLRLYELAARLFDELRTHPEVASTAREEDAILGLVEAEISQTHYDVARDILVEACARPRGPRRILDLTLAHVLAAAGELGEASRRYGALAEAGGLRAVERRVAIDAQALLAPWRSPRVEPLPDADTWALNEIGHLRLGDDGALEIRDTMGRVVNLRLPVALPTAGFELRFDVEIEAFEWSQALFIGFLAPPPEMLLPFPRGLFFHLGNTTGTGLTPSLTVNSASGTRLANRPEPGAGLALDTTYHVRFLVAGNGELVLLRISTQDGGCYCNHVLREVQLPDTEGLRLGICQGVTATDRKLAVTVRNLTLLLPDSSVAERREAHTGFPEGYHQALEHLLGRADALEADRSEPHAAWVDALLQWRETGEGESLAPLRADAEALLAWVEGREFLVPAAEMSRLADALK